MFHKSHHFNWKVWVKSCFRSQELISPLNNLYMYNELDCVDCYASKSEENSYIKYFSVTLVVVY